MEHCGPGFAVFLYGRLERFGTLKPQGYCVAVVAAGDRAAVNRSLADIKQAFIQGDVTVTFVPAAGGDR
ncbi:hypothetical protein PSCICP_40370 [Pseudomonas cichorii]|uniref:Uncharacterized protein n=1 Tax=Pseudomonas cichorii TaxID=36746 RepID=A0ABQ1DSQ6_PSECI|nr:hypothetical protein PSCICP_40370 [Pseudomonas cichorii]